MWRSESNFIWKSVILTVIFHQGILSSRAWIECLPSTFMPGCGAHCTFAPLYAKDPKQREDQGSKSSERKSPKSNKKKDSSKERDNEKRRKEEDEEEDPGFFRSIIKRYQIGKEEARKEKEKARREKQLLEMLEKEERESRFTVNGFNYSLSFVMLEKELAKIRDELSGIRAAKKVLSRDEKRPEQRRADIERKNNLDKLEAEKLAEQRAFELRQKRLREIQEKEAKAKQRADLDRAIREAASRKGNLTGQVDDSSDEDKRSNPLAALQKFFTSVVESTKYREEWIVVAPKTAISPGQIVAVTAAGLDLLLVASKDGSSLHCIANSCPHLGTPLETGTLERRPIESSEASGAPKLEEAEILQETDIARLLTQDGCEDCIVCPLHRTAFALESGEVRGEWCPYPPVIGKMMGGIKKQSNLPVFDVRARGKNIEVRLNTPVDSKL